MLRRRFLSSLAALPALLLGLPAARAAADDSGLIMSVHEGNPHLTDEEHAAFVAEWERRGRRLLDVDESAALLKSLRSSRSG